MREHYRMEGKSDVGIREICRGQEEEIVCEG